MQMDGGSALLKALDFEGVEVVFGYPGGAIMPVYDSMVGGTGPRHVLVRHEQGAGHMASGYAHATGKPGVVMVTSGPAATNIVTPLADAYLDSVPVVAITGQVPYGLIGTDAFQETDTTGITMSITKHNYLVSDPNDIPQIVHEAFHIATHGRPGPVLIDLPKNITDAKNPDSLMTWNDPVAIDLPGFKPVLDGKPEDIKAAVELMLKAERPVLYAGGGILKSRGADELRALAEKLNIPVVTTLMARGAIPDSHELNLGMPGMHGNYTAVMAMQESDLLIAMGSRFDDRVTGRLDSFAQGAKVIHVDIDPAELNKIRPADVAIRGDAKRVMGQMLDELGSREGLDVTAWRSTLSGWQENYPLAYEQAEPGAKLKPQMVLERLHALSPEDTIVASGVGQHQMWASQYWKFEKPYRWLNSGGLGTMGYSIPAAIGAKAGMPDATVWAVDGDGCFQMTCQELITAAVEGIPVKIALLNNTYLGMVRQWQEMFYENRLSEVDLSGPVPDYIKLSEAMGCVAIRVEDPDEVDAAIEKANSINDRPVVVEFLTEPNENVYPMVPGGKSNSEVVVPPFQQKESK